MFDYVESRTFALSAEDVGAAAGAVLATAAQATPLAIAPGVWSGRGEASSFAVTPTYHLRAVPNAAGGSVVEIRVRPDISLAAWAIVAFFFFVFFPAAIFLLYTGREKFRRQAKLSAASIFASLGTTSGLVAAGYAAAPPPPF